MTLPILSPSSINTFKQCPRKYFYNYIMKLDRKPSIHLIRGNVAHTVLERFFELNPDGLSDKWDYEMQTLLFDMFRQEWDKAKEELDTLDMSVHDKLFYFTETKKMFENWFSGFKEKLEAHLPKKSLKEAFAYLTPKTELHYKDTTYKVQGYIDAIHEWGDGVHILDYKTSKKDTITPEYRLQLGIYALLYQQKHGVKPKSVGINFLKFGEKYLEVDDLLINDAAREIKDTHKKTRSTDIADYPKHITPLCKWSTGQCDFYETCFKKE